MKLNFIITDDNITVNYQGQTHIVKRADSLADNLIRAIKENRLDDIPNLVSVARAMEHQSKGNVVVKDGELFVKGVRVPTELARKIQKFMDEGLPYQPLVKFAENLQGNPSFRAVNELFKFLEKNDHPLTQDGNFLAFKKVKSDFTDVHTGTFDNHPGQVLEMPRNQVDEDPESHCSHGFHVGNWRYCHEFYSSDGIMLEVEVNPADVVSVPNDLDEKIRVCKYKVLGVVDSEFSTSPLRVTDPSYVPADEDESDNGYAHCDVMFCDDPADCEECICCVDHCNCDVVIYACQDCGEPCEVEYGLCENCGDDTKKNTCGKCGEECEDNFDLCMDCEAEQEEEVPLNPHYYHEYEDN